MGRGVERGAVASVVSARVALKRENPVSIGGPRLRVAIIAAMPQTDMRRWPYGVGVIPYVR
jgi:hypothetical protein